MSHSHIILYDMHSYKCYNLTVQKTKNQKNKYLVNFNHNSKFWYVETRLDNLIWLFDF